MPLCVVKAEMSNTASSPAIDAKSSPGSLGVCLELCAGIVDKKVSLEETAQAELLEECGYKVSCWWTFIERELGTFGIC